MLTVLGHNEIKEDENGHNVLTVAEGLKYGFDWAELSKQIGYENPSPSFICNSLNYLKYMMKLLITDNVWQSKKWRSYFLYINFRQIIIPPHSK